MKKLWKAFDSNYLELSYLSFKYGFITFILIIILVFLMLVIKKDYYYLDNIVFTSNNTGKIVVDKNRINDIKDINKMMLGNMIINYNIEKINEIDDVYLVDVKFEEGLDIKEDTYKVVLFKENILEYIIRIVKGDFK